MRVCSIAVSLVLVLGGCGDDAIDLVVELRTDFTPGREFGAVEARLDEGPWTGMAATLGQDFVSGRRIAEYPDLAAGQHTVDVRLVGAGGPIATRRTLVELTGSFGLTVVITRDCAGVMCPGAGDDPIATECLGGRCVEPGCQPDNPVACGTADCTGDGECPSGPACTAGLCVGGACLLRPDDGACAPMQRCDTELGCVGDATLDAGPPTDGGGPMDAGATDACIPSAELCDGIDNDCEPATLDGADEPTLGMACDGPGDDDSCMDGMIRCSREMLSCNDPSAPPFRESCNAIDDDCDGLVDEGFMTTCPSCLAVPRGATTYLFCQINQVWGIGRGFCVMYGYELVTIEDDAEASFLTSMATTMGPGLNWWIGLHDMAREDTFVWDDGSASGFRDWAGGQPDNDTSTLPAGQDCVTLRADGWYDDECDDNNLVICEVP